MEQLVLEPFTEELRTRPNELMTEELYRDVTIVTQANAFMTSRRFEMWAERVFFPAVQERCETFA
jgi:hypothetical protein